MSAPTDPSARRVSPWLVLPAGAAILIALAVLLNTLRCAFVHDDRTSRQIARFFGVQVETIDRDRDSWTVDWAYGNVRVRVRAKGNIEFNPEETRVLAISPGGYFEAESWEGDRHRYLKLLGTEEGVMRTWEVNEDPGEEADADRWLEGVLPEFFRHTGFGAETRAAAILEQQGVEGLFAEIDRISAGDIQASYFLAGLGPEGSHPEWVAPFVDRAAETIQNDASLSRFLRRVAVRSDFDPAAQAAVVRAAARLDSDATKRGLLLSILDQPALTDEAFEGMLTTASGITSDHEQARFLRGALETRGAGVMTDPAFLAAMETISSDAETRRLLQEAVETQDLSPAGRRAVLEAVTGMFSDTEKRRVLVAFTEAYPVEEETAGPFFKAVSSVGSDREQGRVLGALLDAEFLDRATLSMSMQVAGTGLSSDSELSSFLRSVASSYPLDEPLRASYREAMESLSSEHEKERAQAALDRNPPP